MPIEAENPEDAALQAKGILQDPENIAWVFATVSHDDLRKVMVDAEFDEAIRLP